MEGAEVEFAVIDDVIEDEVAAALLLCLCCHPSDSYALALSDECPIKNRISKI